MITYLCKANQSSIKDWNFAWDIELPFVHEYLLNYDTISPPYFCNLLIGDLWGKDPGAEVSETHVSKELSRLCILPPCLPYPPCGVVFHHWYGTRHPACLATLATFTITGRDVPPSPSTWTCTSSSENTSTFPLAVWSHIHPFSAVVVQAKTISRRESKKRL